MKVKKNSHFNIGKYAHVDVVTIKYFKKQFPIVVVQKKEPVLNKVKCKQPSK